MAKRQRTKTEQAIEDFAEDLGRILGTARAKADNWLGQRQQIAKTLSDIRDTASNLLTQLGDASSAGIRNAMRRGRAAQKAGAYAPAPASKRKRRKMSAKARAAISRAQKARWAKQKAANKGD